MNVPEAQHCSGCGHRLGLEPSYDPSDVSCPTCPEKLARYRSGSGSLFDCGSCGGQFVEHALLRDLLERREVAGSLVPRKPARFNPLKQPLVYRKCPACGELMNRKNFGTTSGVIVDICSLHGFWFDAGELPLVLKFVEDGGLALARRRQLETERRPIESVQPFELYRAPPDSSDDLWSQVASLGLGLLQLLTR